MSQQFCRKCGAPLKDGFRFCEKCGTPITQDPSPAITPVQQNVTGAVAQNKNETREGQTVLLQGDKCMYCGALNRSGAKFCEKCGRTLDVNIPPVGGSSVMPPNSHQPQNQPGKKNGKTTALIIILVVLLVVVIGVGGFLVYTFVSGNKTEDSMETETIDNQNGLKTTDNGTTDNPYADPELEPSKIPAGDDASKHTYELVKADITWSEAERLAEEKGGYLACISDQNEESEIVNYLAQFNDLKIVYIGAKRGTVGFKWMSGEQFTYYNWAASEPNNYNNVENFVCLYNADGSGWKWNDCPDNMYQQGNGQFTGYTGYLIEYNSVSNTNTATTNTATTNTATTGTN